MILVLMIVVPCCLVGLLVYAGMSRWELTADPTPYHSQPSRLPRLTLRETVLDWPVPQFQRLHPGVLITIIAVLAVWVIAWIVVFFVGLSMLRG